MAKAVVEGDTVEFKQQMPSKKAADPWDEGKNEIGDYARSKLLPEVVAFANAHGGHLILGIEESPDRPRRAVGELPIQRCLELAERLQMQSRNCIDPQLPHLEIVGVPTRPDGSGAVVFRVPEPRLAPHRYAPTAEATIRRRDRCEPMSMREIQDLTLQRVAQDSRRGALLAERAKAFHERLDREMAAVKPYGLVAMRAILIPAALELVVPREALSAIAPHFETVHVADGTRAPRELELPWTDRKDRTILRGRQFSIATGGSIELTAELLQSGVVEYVLLDRSDDGVAAMEDAVWLAANALISAHFARVAAGVGSAEIRSLHRAAAGGWQPSQAY